MVTVYKSVTYFSWPCHCRNSFLKSHVTRCSRYQLISWILSRSIPCARFALGHFFRWQPKDARDNSWPFGRGAIIVPRASLSSGQFFFLLLSLPSLSFLRPTGTSLLTKIKGLLTRTLEHANERPSESRQKERLEFARAPHHYLIDHARSLRSYKAAPFHTNKGPLLRPSWIFYPDFSTLRFFSFFSFFFFFL